MKIVVHTIIILFFYASKYGKVNNIPTTQYNNNGGLGFHVYSQELIKTGTPLTAYTWKHTYMYFVASTSRS